MRPGGLEILLRHQMLADQRRIAREIAPVLGELHLILVQLRLRGRQLRACLVQRGTLGAVVQSCQHLPAANVLAFLEVHMGQLSGDLRRDRCLALRSDIAGGLQNSRRRGARGRGHRRRFAHLDHSVADVEDRRRGGDHDYGDDGRQPPFTAADGGIVALGAIDPQLMDEMGLVGIG